VPYLSVTYYKRHHRNQKAKTGLCTKSPCISKICTAGGRKLPKTEQEDIGRDYKAQEVGDVTWIQLAHHRHPVVGTCEPNNKTSDSTKGR